MTAATLPTPPRYLDAWYVICRSEELAKGAVLARKIWGKPVAVFRGESGKPGALLDRCPHRNVPLSYGEVRGDQLMCGYHGWQFDQQGSCKTIPSFMGEADKPGRKCEAFATVEQQGFVWIWGRAGAAPVGEPFRFPKADDPAYLTVRHEVRAKATLHAVIENALDVPHTAYLHGGLFRQEGGSTEVECVLKRYSRRAECQFIGESRPTGLAGRILSPSGGEITHYDRFFLPSIVLVEYRIGDENHVLLGGACTPVDDYDTKMFACVSARSARIPHFMIKPLIQPIALKIFGQDAEVLALQTETLGHFGEEKYASTDIDLLGPHILRLLRRAEKGDIDSSEDDAPYEKRVKMRL
jgi:phenylpropionate dioxygenase-like ring-hydroxylating dioxygenase large terminal subunit